MCSLVLTMSTSTKPDAFGDTEEGKAIHGGTEFFSNSFRHLEDSPEVPIHFFSAFISPFGTQGTVLNSIPHSPGCLSPFELSIQPKSCLLLLLCLCLQKQVNQSRKTN